VSRTQIRSELHEMDMVELVDGFQFYDDLLGDHEVDAGSPNWHSLKCDVDWKLRLEGYALCVSETRIAL
jgi:hypothetical protein